MPKINISSGPIYYKTYPLYSGVKTINKKIARENLLLIKGILEKNSIPFGLIAGTLLGAVREHDFITHDEDIDLFILEEYKLSFFDILPILIEHGFHIARYDRRGLLSVIRNREYIDLYFFCKYKENIRNCSGWLIPDSFLVNTCTISFLGESFRAPADYLGYLKFEYGENWKIPVVYKRPHINAFLSFLFNVKELVKEKLPDSLYFMLVKHSENRLMKSSCEKIDKYFGYK